MLIFLVGMFVGAFLVIFVMGLICASDYDDERKAEMCRGCPYEDYSGNYKDCEYCHNVEDGGRRHERK